MKVDLWALDMIAGYFLTVYRIGTLWEKEKPSKPPGFFPWRLAGLYSMSLEPYSWGKFPSCPRAAACGLAWGSRGARPAGAPR